MADNTENALNGGLLNSLAHPATVNVLGAYRDAAQTANSIWANREWQAKQAAGAAQQGAIDPTTGEYNPLRAGQLLSQAGPSAALAAPASLESSQRLSDAQLAQAQKKVAWVNSASGAALQQGDFSDAGMMRIMHEGLATGMMSMPEVQRQLATMPPDAAGRAKWLQQHQMTSASTQQQLEQTYGKPITVDDGQGVQGGVRNERSGAITMNGPQVPTGYPTRSQGADMVEVSDGQGNKYKVPAATLPGYKNAINPDSPLGTGRLPPGLRNPNAPQTSTPGAAGTTPPAAPGAMPTGATLSSLGPAQSAALTKTGGDSAAAFQQYAADGNKAVSQNAILGNMLADTKDFTTGPLNTRIKAFQSFASTYAPKISGNWGLDSKTVAANESFDKLAAQLADAQGAGSDNRLAVNQAANPHGEMAPASVDLVLRQLQGNADYTRAKADLAHAYPDKSDNTGFETAARKNLDPRAFQFARMTVPQRQTYAAALSKDDKTAVQGAYNWAVTHGMIGGPGASQ